MRPQRCEGGQACSSCSYPDRRFGNPEHVAQVPRLETFEVSNAATWRLDCTKAGHAHAAKAVRLLPPKPCETKQNVYRPHIRRRRPAWRTQRRQGPVDGTTWPVGDSRGGGVPAGGCRGTLREVPEVGLWAGLCEAALPVALGPGAPAIHPARRVNRTGNLGERVEGVRGGSRPAATRGSAGEAGTGEEARRHHRTPRPHSGIGGRDSRNRSAQDLGARALTPRRLLARPPGAVPCPAGKRREDRRQASRERRRPSPSDGRLSIPHSLDRLTPFTFCVRVPAGTCRRLVRSAITG